MQASEFADEYGDWLDGRPSARRPGWLSQTLGEMLHTPFLSVAPQTPIEDVVEKMNGEHASAALVVENGKILGIFTERDVLSRVVSRIDGLFAPVCEMMTKDPDVLPESTMLSAALRTLAIGAYHHLPVVDDAARPVALVSLQTIIAYLADAFPNDILNAPPERDSFPPERHGA